MKINALNWQDHPVLTLNVSYEALGEVPAHRAITLLLAGAAETERASDPEFIVHSQHLAIPVPEVIRLKRYVILKRHFFVDEHSKASLTGVLKRDRNECAYCGGFATTMDHVIPRCQGGADSWGNIVAACFDCNQRKGPLTPAQAGMRLRYPAKVPSFDRKRQKQIWRQIAVA